MMTAWEDFPVSESLKQGVASRLSKKEEIFPVVSDPLFASLVTCLGLQFELGNPEWDRLSAPLGIDLNHFSENPWHSEIITSGSEIGVRFWIPGVDEFLIRHPDFASILSPLSLDSQGRLSQLIFFPAQIAREYKRRGLELVIVRDWALNGLSLEHQLNYIVTNEKEVTLNSARFQAEIMAAQQVAFSGTHDLADHLLGGNGHRFAWSRELYGRVRQAYREIFPPGAKNKNITLLASYVLGVVLDDMAQPAWYGCTNHREVVEWALEWLRETTTNSYPDVPHKMMPPSFPDLMTALRDKTKSHKAIHLHFQLLRTTLTPRHPKVRTHLPRPTAKKWQDVRYLTKDSGAFGNW